MRKLFPHLVLAILQIYFLICFPASSESKGEDGYDLSTKFDEIPVTASEGEEPVNIHTEVALETNLCKTKRKVNRSIYRLDIVF